MQNVWRDKIRFLKGNKGQGFDTFPKFLITVAIIVVAFIGLMPGIWVGMNAGLSNSLASPTQKLFIILIPAVIFFFIGLFIFSGLKNGGNA
jgi:hypothetical protein